MDLQGNIDLLAKVLQFVSICNILSAIPGCVKMWKTGKTDGWPTLFFVIGLCGSLGMFVYGLLLNNTTLYMLNGLQGVLFVFYIISYLVLTEKKSEPLMYIAGACAYLSVLSKFYMDQTQVAQKANLVGSVSSCVFLLMNCSTLLEVITAVRKKSGAFDMTMLMAGMVNNVLWLTYGVLLNDLYLFGPTLPYLLTGVMKLMLISIYGPEEKVKKKTQ